MKASDVRGGMVSTLELQPTSGPLDPQPVQGEEVELVRAADEVLLRYRTHEWPVEPTVPSGRPALADVLDSGMPSVAWLAEAKADRLTVQVHRFAGGELRFSEAFDVGVDERAAEDLRKNFRIDGAASDLAAWLDERVVLGAGSNRRAIVAPGRQGTMNRFRMVGHKIAVDVRRDKDRLLVERVTKGGSPDRLTLTLLVAPIAFKDATAAAAVASGARHALEEAVRSQDSYLRVWVEYNRLEEQAVLSRARNLGALPYTRCQQRRDGGWTFWIGETTDLDKRLRGLGDSDRFELEAGSRAPDFESMDTPSNDEDPLTARLFDFDLGKRTVDLAPPDEAEEQPKPPPKGYLFLSLRGDRTRLQRRAKAEELLRTGRCPMPWLGLLLEGRPSPRPTRRARAAMSSAVRAAFGGGRPTARQLEAIEVALNTPDIALIQGPPGTGKTKVITALQRRIAELADEGVEVSHRILLTSAQHDAVEEVVQRSEVFGLPAVKVGSRRGDDGAGIDGVEKFRNDRIEALRATLREPPETERLSRARRAAVAILRAPLPPAEVAAQLRELLDAIGDLLTPQTGDRVRDRVQVLERGRSVGDPELERLRLDAARALSYGEEAFLDGGARRARKALERLKDVLTPDEASLLQRCADWVDDHAPPFLAQVEALRGSLIDRLSAPPAPTRPEMDDETQRLLCDVMDELDQRRKRSSVGDEAVLAEWLHDLETDPDAVRTALEHYTAVLAATLQQAAGRSMLAVRGIDTGSVTFETVIVDEAARSNPLDLFIPLTMAKRRVVLVGDHRQLPHMLEPDVERELSDRAAAGDLQKETVEAVKHSLFQRLWNLLRRLEEQDGIRRTVTLDTQFRMHPLLGDFVSRMFYERWGDGRVSSGGVPEAYEHQLPGYTKGDRWAVAAWLDVPGGQGAWEQRGRSKSRRGEAQRIAKEVRRLIEADEKLTFGIIAFYRAQVDAIGEALIAEGLAERTENGRWRIAERWRRTTNEAGEVVERLRVGTVDAFQGKEFDVVFLSVTRSNDLPCATDEQQRRKYGHLMLDNRLCVAMSRQHRLLIAVGDLDFIRDAEPLLPLREFVKLCEGGHGVVR